MRKQWMNGWGVNLLLALFVLGAAVAVRAQSDAGLGMRPPTPSGSGQVVLEQEWAGWLAESMGLTAIFHDIPGAEELFGLLCADRGQAENTGSLRRVQDASPGAGGRVRFRIEVQQTALYQLAVAGQGRQRWIIDGQAIEHIEPGSSGVAIPAELIPLRKGPHELEVFMGIRARVDRVDLSVFRPACVAPVDGWHAERPLTHAAAARTLVRAMNLVPLLPVEGDEIILDGTAHAVVSEAGRTLEARVSQAGDRPVLLEYPVNISEPGIHTLEARVRGLGDQIWSLDDRYHSRIRVAGDGIRAVHVMSVPMASGQHVVRVQVPAGGTVDDIKFKRHATRGSDELALLDRLGLATRAPTALLTVADADRYLGSEVFRERTARFLRREGLRGPAEPVVLAEREADLGYERPLSPALPADL
jgi:hypothetical protein